MGLGEVGNALLPYSHAPTKLPVYATADVRGQPMGETPTDVLLTPRFEDLSLTRIANKGGLAFTFFPSGAVFAIEHEKSGRRILINQVLASPIADGMARLYLRVGGPAPAALPLIGSEAKVRVGSANRRFVWDGESDGLAHRVTLWLHPDRDVWLWRVEVANRSDNELPCDAVLIQDLGLGDRNYLMGNEAYASQYLDHHIPHDRRLGPVVMTRQNLSQGGAFPWVAHGCLDGAAGFATDYREIMGPAGRDADGFAIPFGVDLPSRRLQYETGCAALQSSPAVLAPGDTAAWTFFAVYRPDHPAASSDDDLAVVGEAERAGEDFAPLDVSLSPPVRSLLHEAKSAISEPLDDVAIRARYPRRMQIERIDGQALSFFTPYKSHNRHVVLRDKERLVARRHGALLRSGGDMLPSEALLCLTAWMHGVFGAQLTIGNTSFHKLFSVSRDPYNITRGSGLRILAELNEGWRLLTVPSAFEMGLADCRWVYRLRDRTIVVSTVVAPSEPAAHWRVTVEGAPLRFLVFGHLVLGEREYESAGVMEIDATWKRLNFRPDKQSLWGQRYPQAVYHLVTGTPDEVEAVGGDELLYLDGQRRSGAYAAIRTRLTNGFAFAVVGSLTDPPQAETLATKYGAPMDEATMVAKADRAWRAITRGVRIKGEKADAKAIDASFPWLVHDAMIHLTVSQGLEQYTGAAWGTRDVCQGPLELLLSLEHDRPAKEIVRTVFAQQYVDSGDWPQWFMLEPYSAIQDKEAHGDVIVWPLKALCDYIEATGEFGFLDEPVAWRREDNFERTRHRDPVSDHVAKLVAVIRSRLIPGTRLVRYGHGDWNDSLQPVDPAKQDWMVSSWTIALLYEQLRRYAEILRLAGREDAAKEHDALAAAMSDDFNRFLVRDGFVAGYAVFALEGGEPELLLHPSDKRTGLSFSLIPMTQAILGNLFTTAQAKRHLEIIRKHLLFPDGARLMDRPLAYHGGVETMFRRAESAAFFGREIGLMYTHSHLRYAEAMSVMGEPEAMWDSLLVANPIAVTDRLAHAALRQRNSYFSSSDAAFWDRYQASAEWGRVKAGTIAADGGWRVYSSGPGLYAYILIQHVFGLRRRFGRRVVAPRLPGFQGGLRLEWPGGGGSVGGRVSGGPKAKRP